MNVEIPAAHVEHAWSDRVTIKIPVAYRDAWLELASKPNVKKSWQLYVKLAPPRKPRTTGWKSQSHHVNGHVQQIAAYTGDSFDEVKMHIKREAIADGYPVKTASWGDVIPQSEADASTVECAMLIEAAHRVASFLGVRLKEDNDD